VGVRRLHTRSFEDYLFERTDSLHRLGGDADVKTLGAEGAERVIIEGRILFPGGIELTVFEVVEKTQSGSAHRVKYRYQCRVEDVVLIRYERDPFGHPDLPEHKHCLDGTRIAWTEPISPAVVATEMWEAIKRWSDRGHEKERRTA
jgi:hypothetical protein